MSLLPQRCVLRSVAFGDGRGRARGGRTKSRPWLIDAAFATRPIRARPQSRSRPDQRRSGRRRTDLIRQLRRRHRRKNTARTAPDRASSCCKTIIPRRYWNGRRGRGGFIVDKVQSPADHDWTARRCQTIERPGAAADCRCFDFSVQWTDGGALDSIALRRNCVKRRCVLVDATHGAGVLEFDVRKLDPDFVVFPTYKWLLALMAAPSFTSPSGIRTQSRWSRPAPADVGINAEGNIYFKDLDYVGNARRFDMGERDHFISLEMASLGIERMATWGCAAITERLAALTARLADGLRGNRLVPGAQSGRRIS